MSTTATIKQLKVVNPFDQSSVCTLSYHTGEEVDAALSAAREAFAAWRNVSLDERSKVVDRGLDYFRKNAESIARDITFQMGKPIAQARGEVATLIARGERAIADAPAALAADVLPVENGLVRRIENEPLGVVFDIAAWNYPLLIAINVIAPALLAGNVILIKHASQTPLCGQAFEKAFADSPVKNLVTHLIVNHEQAAAIIRDKRVNHVSFTGSVGGGRQIYRNVAESRFIDVGLELGGKDPAYIAADADLDFAVPNIVEGAMYNAGQSCCGIERVYVHASVYDVFIERATEEVHKLQMGDPFDERTTMGPLAARKALDELKSQVDDAIQRGGRLITGGKPASNTNGNFFEPTLLADVPQNALIMQDESFGPTLPIAMATDDDDAIAKMNDTIFGLTASVWTQSGTLAERIGREVNAGTVFQNRCDFVDPALPWTGYGDSGKGSTLSRYGFYHLTRRKSIHFRPRV